MGRIRIAGRLALIVVGGIVLVQMLFAAVYYANNRTAAPRPQIEPLLSRIAALTHLVERLPPAEQAVALRAATGAGFKPSLRAERPVEVRSALLWGAERRLRNMLGQAPERYVALALVSRRGDHQPVERLRDLFGAEIHAVVGLAAGGYLDVVARGGPTLRLFGVPVGLIAGILGFAVALAALLAVRHETRPLSDLAASVERFGKAIEVQPVKARGAPDIRALIGAVNAMQARIVDLIKSRTLVLGAISHDLRTYVTRLRLRIELLPESPQRAKIVADLESMQALMDDALAFARASFANGGEATADLAQIVRMEQAARAGQGAAVKFTGAEAPVFVRGGASGLSRVVANLVDNALAYGGCADLSLHAAGEFAELWVEDRGPGIPPAERAQVFEPFHRLDPSRNRESGGAGLGLTIVRQILEANGGSVAIEDRPGGGARIRVRLPRGQAGEAAAA